MELEKIQRGNLMVIGLSVGMMPTNCYLAWDNISKEAVVIDPADDAEKIKSWIEKEGLDLKAILLTHGHFDHIYAVDNIRDEFGVEVYAHEKEQQILQNKDMNCSLMIRRLIETKADVLVKDEEELQFGSLKLKVIHTPGHTHGSVCYYFYENDVLFSGDTMFCRSVGRDDLPTGNWSDLHNSIKKLLLLPEEVIVFPGHRGPTTIAGEKKDESLWY